MLPNRNAPGGQAGGEVDEQAGGRVVMSTVPPSHRAIEQTRALAMAAAELVDDIIGQQQREAVAFAEGYRLGYGAAYDVAYGAAHEHVLNVMTEAQGRLHRELVAGTVEMDRWRRARAETTISAYCVRADCQRLVTVHHRADFRIVLCHGHQPVQWCHEHRDNDRCAYLARLQQSQRDEYTGGPVEWETGRPKREGTAA